MGVPPCGIKSLIINKLINIYSDKRAVSSVGLEHYLDRVGVTGSNPVQPTQREFKSNKKQ